MGDPAIIVCSDGTYFSGWRYTPWLYSDEDTVWCRAPRWTRDSSAAKIYESKTYAAKIRDLYFDDAIVIPFSSLTPNPEPPCRPPRNFCPVCHDLPHRRARPVCRSCGKAWTEARRITIEEIVERGVE